MTDPTTPQPPAQPPLNNKVIYVNYFDEINEAKTKVLMAVVTEIVTKHKPDSIYFLFSSNGGRVNAGITLYNFLRSLPVEIVMHNTGSINSIATVIFLAGEKRYASQHSSFLFHGIKFNVKAETGFHKAQMEETLSSLTQDENKIAGIIAERSQLTEDEIRKLFLRGESKDPSFALQKGFIHEIRNPSIPKNAQIASLNIQ